MISYEAASLLRERYSEPEERSNLRVLAKLRIGAIRCQARYVHIEIDETIMPISLPWAVPKWVWGLPDGRLDLLEDTYENIAPEKYTTRIPENFRKITQINLQGLRFHPREFCEAFDINLPIQYKRELAKSKYKNKSIPKEIQIARCENWLINEFQRDVNKVKRKEKFWELVKLDRQFKYITKRSFEKAWSRAVRLYPERAKAGRPKGT